MKTIWCLLLVAVWSCADGFAPLIPRVASRSAGKLLMQYRQDEECHYFEVERARDCATGQDCSVEELEGLRDGLRHQRVENEVFGLCSDLDLDLELLERAITSQLEQFIVAQKQKEQLPQQVTPVEAKEAKEVATPRKRTWTSKPRKINADELVAKALGCTSDKAECSLEELEELKASIDWIEVQNNVLGACDEEEFQLVMLQQALAAQLDKLVLARASPINKDHFQM